MMKRTSAFALALTLLLGIMPQFALAAEPVESIVEIIQIEDGSYITVTIEEQGTRAVQTRVGNKKYTYTANDGTVEWVITLSGSFTYTGTTSICTASSVDVTVSASNWYVDSQSASKSGSAATANVTMGRKLLGITIAKDDYTLTLTCDKNGNLS